MDSGQSAFQMHPSKSKNVLLNGNEKSVSLGWAPGLLPGALAETGAQHGCLALMLPSSPASQGPQQNRSASGQRKHSRGVKQRVLAKGRKKGK